MFLHNGRVEFLRRRAPFLLVVVPLQLGSLSGCFNSLPLLLLLKQGEPLAFSLGLGTSVIFRLFLRLCIGSLLRGLGPLPFLLLLQGKALAFGLCFAAGFVLGLLLRYVSGLLDRLGLSEFRKAHLGEIAIVGVAEAADEGFTPGDAGTVLGRNPRALGIVELRLSW